MNNTFNSNNTSKSINIENISFAYEDKIVFEEYGIEFTDDDFKGVKPEALIACKKKLMKLLIK